jgi:hypothetical protein
VFAPGKSPVEVQPETLDIYLLRKVYADYVDWGPGFSSCGECDMDRLGFKSKNGIPFENGVLCAVRAEATYM